LSTSQAVGTKQSLIAAKGWLFKAAEKLRSATVFLQNTWKLVLLNLGSTRLRGEEGRLLKKGMFVFCRKLFKRGSTNRQVTFETALVSNHYMLFILNLTADDRLTYLGFIFHQKQSVCTGRVRWADSPHKHRE
jgi:hypothetical protein